MIFGNEKDILWEELNLGGLLDTMKLQNSVSQAVEVGSAPKSDALIKHNKMVNKPSYSVLMDRYNSSPHKPKSVKVTKLDRLADPIKGRYTHFEKYMNTDTPSTYDDEPISFKSGNSGHNSPVRSNSNSPTKKSKQDKTPPAAFFLTEGLEDDADDDQRLSPSNLLVNAANKIALNKVKAGNGFAALLRNRVEEANRLDKLQVPVRLDAKQKPAYGARGGVQKARITQPAPAKGGPKQPSTTRQPRNWQENMVVHHIRGDSNKKTLVQVVGGKKGVARGNYGKRDTSIIRDPHTNKVKKVISSGYGGGAAAGGGNSKGGRVTSSTTGKSKERVLKKIVAPAPVLPSLTDPPNNVSEIKRKLRSKDTIDILDAIPEGTGNMEKSKRANNKSGTQSAPNGRSREKRVATNQNDSSFDNIDEPYQQPAATRMTRKVQSLQPSNRKNDEHWNQKLSPKNVHPNSYLAQKKQQELANASKDSKKPAPSSVVTSQYSVVRNVDLLDAVSPRPREDSSIFDLQASVESVKTTNNVSTSSSRNAPAADINTTLARLKSFEGSGYEGTGNSQSFRSSKNGKLDTDINSQFAKQAAKLGEYFNSADAIMSKYKNLANDLE